MIRPTESWWILSEPGDATRYEFVVSTLPDRNDALFIASVARGQGCPRFVGYTYNIDSLLAFRKDWAEVFDQDGTGRYRDTVRRLDSHHLIGYAASHSDANPWTALAALMAGARVAEVLTATQADGGLL